MEKRQSTRRQILEHFSFFVCVPKLGATKLKVSDISEKGIGFQIDTLGEFKLDEQSQNDLRFYVNQTLYLPLKVNIVRQYEENGIQYLGGTFVDTETTAHQAFVALVQMIDKIETEAHEDDL
jgi:hypothetical protein